MKDIDAVLCGSVCERAAAYACGCFLCLGGDVAMVRINNVLA